MAIFWEAQETSPDKKTVNAQICDLVRSVFDVWYKCTIECQLSTPAHQLRIICDNMMCSMGADGKNYMDSLKMAFFRRSSSSFWRLRSSSSFDGISSPELARI